MADKKYIDAEAFFTEYPELNTAPYNTFPAADVVEVIRCRECEHSEELNNRTYLCYVSGGCCHKPDFFCADGERKEKDNDS
jgi:hypothetical protein